MRLSKAGWCLLVAAVVCALSTLPSPARAAEQPIFGPTQYTRSAGVPNQFTTTFALPATLMAPFRLHVQNGNPNGTNRVSSATITLNGIPVASPSDFSQQVAGFDRTVTLQAQNTLQVRLTSAPGSFLILTLFGTISPPTLTKLEPAALSITQGGTGTLTATISAPQSTATILTLSSDHPAVASVPATATVPAGQGSVAILVTGLSPGIATIIASLNGSSVHSTVTVRPAGPTITSLKPDTLQITQGASGTLTVTISAVQPTDTLVPLTSSDQTIVGLPPSASVTVPAGHTSQDFAVYGVSPGTSTITASLNNTSAHSQVTVVTPLPTVVSLLPPVLPLTEASSGTLTITLNAAQPTDTDVFLSTSDPTIVGLPSGEKVTVPTHTLSAAFTVTGLRRGMATVTASLNGTTATAAVEVQPPPPTLQALTCPGTLAFNATSLCTLTLNATQLTGTTVALAVSPSGVVTIPPSVTVPADTLGAQFPVTGVAVGSAILTAGPLNGTTQTATVQVLPPPPTIVSLVPDRSAIFVGAHATVTLTLNAAQLTDTVIFLTSSAPGVASVPPSVTVPAGSLSTSVIVTGLTPGSATITAGPLNGTQAQSTITVNQLPPTVISLTPTTLSLPKGKAGVLTVGIAPTQPDPTVVPLGSSDPTSVEVPPSVTVPAGATTAAFPVLAHQVTAPSAATITAGPLNNTSQQATVTVTPPELVSLAVSPAEASIPKGRTQAFIATGTFTDTSAQDLTASATWTSSDATVASIAPTGVATGLSVGQATITATVGSISGAASLTVTPPELASLAITPSNAAVQVGQTVQFTATGTITDGTTQNLTAAVTWASSIPAVATITTTGLATGLAPGSATITATHTPTALTASTTFTVTLPPPTLTNFTPTSGRIGDSVAITGTNLFNVQSVLFNGISAPRFTVNSSTSITVAVPSGASTGPLAVTTPGGTATSTGVFIVLPTQDFQLSVAPGTLTLPVTGQGAFNVSLSGSEGFIGLTNLAVTGVSIGTTASFGAPTLTAGQSTLLTLTTTGTTPTGSYPLTVTATGLLNGVSTTRSTPVTLQVQAAGQTVLMGQVRDENERPLPGASIKLGGSTLTPLGTTDAGGNFLVNLSTTGPTVFLIDGSPLTTSAVRYPTIPVTVNIQAGVVSSLGFVPHLTAQPLAKLIPITPGQDTVLTDPDLPGFQMTIPAGVQIIGWDGQPNTRVGVTAVPIDRSPLPPIPPGQTTRQIYLFSFGKVGGGLPTGNIPVDTPNDVGGLPGDQVDLYYFNEAPDGSAPNQWEKYGTGTVSSDGTRILTDLNPATGKPYGIPRFCCGGRWNGPPPKPPTGPSGGSGDGGDDDAEPVDTATGFFYLTKTDLVLPGIIPITITRTYRTNLTGAGPFGLGTSWPYDLFLQPPPNGSPYALVLYSPGNRQDLFSRQPDGTFINTTSPALRGAVATPAGEGLALRYKDRRVLRFDHAGRLISQTDRNGNVLTITRDPQGRVTTLTEPTGRSLTVTYTGKDPRADQITDPIGRTVAYTYDTQGRLASVTDPAGGVTKYTYDSNHRMSTITDPRGITFLTNEYDANGRVVKQTQADGGIWQFAYTATGGFISQTTVTDPRGNPTTHRFNSFGYLISRTDALGQTTTFTRQPGTNLLLSTTDPLGRVTRFTYDAQGNVTSITDPAGNTRTFTYDATFSKVTSITDPLRNLTQFAYDANGNLTAITEPLGAATEIAYNQAGQPISTTDPLGNTALLSYNASGDLAQIVDPLGHTTTRSYDGASRLIGQTDPRGMPTVFEYDPLDRLTSIVDALGSSTALTYDSNGNLLTVTDARGHTVTFEYDSMDRLSRRLDQLGRAERFSYDVYGNPVSSVDRKGQTSTFAYDPLNRRVQSTFADGAVVTFQYDAGGRLIQTDDTADPHRPILMARDLLDRLAAETTAVGTVSYQYDALGRRTQMTVSGQAPVTYTYDDASRLRTITQAPLTAVDIQYDARGRRTLLALPNGVTTEYQYDAASRLTALIYRNALGALGDLQYTYDPAGNRVAIGGSFARTLLPEPVASATYDAANEQLAFDAKTLSLDSNGNVVAVTDPTGTTVMTWDARNRLSTLNDSSTTAAFHYDPQGRRVVRTLNGASTQYRYDRADAAQELTAEGPIAYLRSLTIDEPLARQGTQFYLADALGSILGLTDAGGTLATRYLYEPFGRPAQEGVASPNPHQFTGREQEGPTGLYAYRLRYYSSVLHRFLSEDPIGLLGGLNYYSYALNNPLLFTDPSGLDVTVTLYPGASRLGHIGVGVNTSETVGHYPSDSLADTLAMLAGLTVPGTVHRDERNPEPGQSLVIPTTPAQDQIMLAIINQAVGQPRPYNLRNRNCAIFVEEALRAGGLQVPNTIYPRDLMQQLQETYGMSGGAIPRVPMYLPPLAP